MLAFSLSSFIIMIYNLLTIKCLTSKRQEQTSLWPIGYNHTHIVKEEVVPAFSFVKKINDELT